MVQPNPSLILRIPLIASPPEARRLGVRIWTSTSGLGSLAYSETAGYRVAAGLPRCTGGQMKDLLSEFEIECARDHRKALYFGIPSTALGAFHKRGILPIGDAPVFDLSRWKDRDSFPAGILAQIRRAEAHGVTVRHYSRLPENLDGLHRCLESWLIGKGMPPLGFLTNPFLLEPWPEHGVWIATWNGEICGFLILSNFLFGDRWRVDLMARRPDAPNGCVELLVASAFSTVARKGHGSITLDLAPLFHHANQEDLIPPRWFMWASACARRLGTSWYSFAGLEKFKAKFQPDSWQPLYGVSQHEKFILPDFLAMLRIFTRMPLRQFGRQALLWRLGSPSVRQAIFRRLSKPRLFVLEKSSMIFDHSLGSETLPNS